MLHLTGDEDLEQKNLEHIDEANREAMSSKVAQMTGETKVLKKKLRKRFGSQMHKENKEMQAACEKYERIKKESMLGYIHGTAGEMKMAVRNKFKKGEKVVMEKVTEVRRTVPTHT